MSSSLLHPNLPSSLSSRNFAESKKRFSGKKEELQGVGSPARYPALLPSQPLQLLPCFFRVGAPLIRSARPRADRAVASLLKVLDPQQFLHTYIQVQQSQQLEGIFPRSHLLTTVEAVKSSLRNGLLHKSYFLPSQCSCWQLWPSRRHHHEFLLPLDPQRP